MSIGDSIFSAGASFFGGERANRANAREGELK